MSVVFLCSELSLCCLFCSMGWEVAPKPLLPLLWTLECIRPHLPMKMKTRMKSHLLLVGGNVASLRGEGLVETRSWGMNNPTEALRFHLPLSKDYSSLYPHVLQFPSNSFPHTSEIPSEKSERRQGAAEIHTSLSAQAPGRNVSSRVRRWQLLQKACTCSEFIENGWMRAGRQRIGLVISVGRAGGQGTLPLRALVLVPTREELLMLPLETNGL